MEYTFLIHPAEEGGYWSEVPALPGCYSQGETIEEALSNSRGAIETHRGRSRALSAICRQFIGKCRIMTN